MVRLTIPLAVVAPGVYVMHLLRPSLRLIEAVAVLVAAVCLLYLVHRLLSTGPYGLPRLLPWRLVAWPWVRWRERPFLGWGRCWFGPTVFAAGSHEDSVGIVGPPRVGKTAGVLVPQVCQWRGPVISTSTKPDVLRATASRRLQLARQHGGDVYVYAPTATSLVEGLKPIRWSPLAGCTDPRVAKLNVETLITTAQTGKGVDNADHWRSGAGRILRPYFYAAAHHPTRPYDFAVVKDWLSVQAYEEPMAILTGLGTFAGQQWARELHGVIKATPDRERGSFYSAAETTVAATSDPTVLRSCSAVDLDPVEFLQTRSTLYIVSPSEHQEAVAPLITALIDSIVTTAYELHRHGDLPARLQLNLDEFANIAPLPKIESTLSQGGGQGVNVSWAVQSLAQLRNRYGEHAAEAIWSATRAKLVWGGLTDGPTLDHVSKLVGEHRVQQPPEVTYDRTRRRTTRQHHEWRPRLSVAELRQLKRGWALLLYHERKPYVVKAPIAARRLRLRRALLAWPVAAPAITPATARATVVPTARQVHGAPAAKAEPHLHVVHEHDQVPEPDDAAQPAAAAGERED